MRLNKSAILALMMLSAAASPAYADVKVVTSIKPVHSLVSAVMQGVGSPGLLVEGAGSPHNYSLKPSQAQQLQEADIVFWMGEELETFLENSIDSIAANAVSVSLLDSHGLSRLPLREGGAFDSHDEHGHSGHDEHGHDDHKDHGHDEHGHDEHGHNDHKDHGHDEHAHDEHGHNDHKDHGHGEFDAHIWLDPQNAKALVHEIAEHLAEIDPSQAAAYQANASAVRERLDVLTAEIESEVASVKDRGYLVFHDAYQYFETRFGVSAIGSITVSPEVVPGAERVRELQEKIRKLDAACVFSEPQFEPKLVATVIENTDARTAVLDPLGATIPKGPDLYFTLIRNMAASLTGCLKRAG